VAEIGKLRGRRGWSGWSGWRRFGLRGRRRCLGLGSSSNVARRGGRRCKRPGGLRRIATGNVATELEAWRVRGLGFGCELLVKDDFAVGAEEHLSEVAEDGGFAGGDAVFGEGEEDFGEDAVYVFWGV